MVVAHTEMITDTITFIVVAVEVAVEETIDLLEARFSTATMAEVVRV